MSATREHWQLNNPDVILLVAECLNRRLQFPALCSCGDPMMPILKAPIEPVFHM